ncbi:type I CRISPR-associated protein Cas8a1/Csx8 [Clostridium sp.]|uniref:type I CRISPR-associated protein Cas8a1/Csx8 n=1 Tax=Clostridium sp. TaxID=1506 RepID=UPI003F2B2BE4
MRIELQNNKYDTALESSDWRYSAAIVGLIRYLDYHDFEYEIKDDSIYYNSKDISEEKYLEFVESWYGRDLHHKVIENILLNYDVKGKEVTDEYMKAINEKLSANTIMKKTFAKIKYDKTNAKKILDIIIENRSGIIKETFRSKSNMYANFANTNQLFNQSQDYCRLLGYYIDAPKKGKSTGYKFNANSFVGQDEKEFDFIPFAFEGNRESFFINDNYTINRLLNSNMLLRNKVKEQTEDSKGQDVRQILFKSIIETSDFIDRDVEVIYKDRGKGYFETLYIRRDSIEIFKNFKSIGIEYKDLCTSYKVTDKYYINVQKEVTESILNNVLLDNLIDVLLKEPNRRYLVSQLIKVNVLIRRDTSMKDKLKGAYGSAKKVVEALETNKLDSYRQKLTSSIIFKDYDRVCQILLQLSNYSGVEFNFVYDLYDNFEDNKDLAYTFINALTKKSSNNSESK